MIYVENVDETVHRAREGHFDLLELQSHFVVILAPKSFSGKRYLCYSYESFPTKLFHRLFPPIVNVFGLILCVLFVYMLWL